MAGAGYILLCRDWGCDGSCGMAARRRGIAEDTAAGGGCNAEAVVGNGCLLPLLAGMASHPRSAASFSVVLLALLQNKRR